jgi:tol-pal system protein YbgF
MMQRHTATWTITILTGFLLSSGGCFWVTTKREGQQMRAEINEIDSRLETREDDLQSKISQLELVLDEATKVLKRNSADLGADVEALATDIRTTQGLITEATRFASEIRAEVQALKRTMDDEREVLSKRLESMEQRLDGLEQQAARALPENADELYAVGKKAFDSRDYATARNVFRQLTVKFPGHDRADDGQYYRGESYYLEKDYDSAIREFQRVFEKYPESSLADDALFRAGEAAQILRRCTEARAYFGLLRQKYPKSSLIAKSRAKDEELKRDLKNTKKCQS